MEVAYLGVPHTHKLAIIIKPMKMKIILIVYLLICGNYILAQVNKSEMFLQKAEEAYELENYEIALNAIDSALIESPEMAGLYDFKSDILVNLRKFEYAGDVLDLAKEKFPNDPYTLCKKGHFEAYIGRPMNSLEEYQKALQLADSDSLKFEIRTFIAVTKHELRDFKNAKSELLDLYKIDTLNLGILLSLGNLEEEINNRDAALKYYFKGLEIDSTDVGILMNIGYLLQRQNKYSESFEFYEKSSDIKNVDDLYFSNQSINLMHLGKDSMALEFIDSSLAINPYNAYAYRNKALILKKLSKLNEACKALNDALKFNFTEIYGDEVLELIKANCK